VISIACLVFTVWKTLKMVTGAPKHAGAKKKRHIWLNNKIKSAFVGLHINAQFTVMHIWNIKVWMVVQLQITMLHGGKRSWPSAKKLRIFLQQLRARYVKPE
jgi:hypothetical protein